MRKHAGFTLIELMIVMVVMAILLAISVASYRAIKITSRDNERHTDIENISIVLEGIYQNGMDGDSREAKHYPSVADVNTTQFRKYLIDHTPVETLYAPGDKHDYYDGYNNSLKIATNNKNISAVTPEPQVTNYIYQPLRRDGSLCTDAPDYDSQCTSYLLYYMTEKPSDNENCNGTACTVRSKQS